MHGYLGVTLSQTYLAQSVSWESVLVASLSLGPTLQDLHTAVERQAPPVFVFTYIN